MLLRPPHERHMLRQTGGDGPPPKSASKRRGLRPEAAPELTWQPPPGYSWDDLPSEARLVQAMHETYGAKAHLVDDLKQQLHALERLRPYKSLAQTYSLAALDPTSTVCRPEAVREGASAMLAGYAKQRYPDGSGDDVAAQPAAALDAPSPASRGASRPKKRLPFTEHPSVRAIDLKYIEKKEAKEQRRPMGRSRTASSLM